MTDTDPQTKKTNYKGAKLALVKTPETPDRRDDRKSNSKFVDLMEKLCDQLEEEIELIKEF